MVAEIERSAGVGNQLGGVAGGAAVEADDRAGAAARSAVGRDRRISGVRPVDERDASTDGARGRSAVGDDRGVAGRRVQIEIETAEIERAGSSWHRQFQFATGLPKRRVVNCSLARLAIAMIAFAAVDWLKKVISLSCPTEKLAFPAVAFSVNVIRPEPSS